MIALVASALVAAPVTFSAEVAKLPPARVDKMRGVSWHLGCPVPLRDLRLVRLKHWRFDGEIASGELIVHHRVTDRVVAAFRTLFARRYPIERMQPASDFGGDDARSMAANNTSAFNCRPVTGRGRGFSAHSYGRAIDVNPAYNPYVKGKVVLPPAAAPWVDRSRPHPARIDARVASAFEDQQFTWGGRWTSLRDYQHFEIPLR